MVKTIIVIFFLNIISSSFANERCANSLTLGRTPSKYVAQASQFEMSSRHFKKYKGPIDWVMGGFSRVLSFEDDLGNRYALKIYRNTDSSYHSVSLGLSMFLSDSILEESRARLTPRIYGFLGEEELSNLNLRFSIEDEIVLSKYALLMDEVQEPFLLGKQNVSEAKADLWDFDLIRKRIIEFRDFFRLHQISANDVQILISRDGTPFLIDFEMYALWTGDQLLHDYVPGVKFKYVFADFQSYLDIVGEIETMQNKKMSPN